jgi:hypothetical protein
MSQHHDHLPEVLHHDRHGFVCRCRDCDCYQIGFGNVRVSQQLPELRAFAQLISHCYDRNRDTTRPALREIHIDTPFPGFGLLFSLLDLERLNHILQKTLLIIDARDRTRLQ